MIRTPISFPNHQPLNRALAAEIVQAASAFESRMMISRQDKLVNAKSTLGLLSLGMEDLDGMVLVVEGVDEAAAAQAVVALLK